MKTQLLFIAIFATQLAIGEDGGGAKPARERSAYLPAWDWEETDTSTPSLQDVDTPGSDPFDESTPNVDFEDWDEDSAAPQDRLSD